MEIAEDGDERAEVLVRDQLHEMLKRMLRIRLFDELASRIRSTLIPGFLHNSIGQEAEIVGACMALREDDYMTGNHRSHGHPIGKGVPLARLMAELLGKKTGVCGGKGGSMHLAAFGAGSLGESGIVGASMPTATGAALSAVLRKSNQVCLCFFGDGAANCGPFHESLNLASIWKLPVVFMCENNRYAGCSSQSKTTAIVDVAARSAAYSIPGVVIDGQDVLAVYRAVREAVLYARGGQGPTLVEAKTYRFCHHMEEDSEPPEYRDAEEVAAWKKRDPIILFESFLYETGKLTPMEGRFIRTNVENEVEEALVFARRSPAPEPKALLEDVFITRT
jgi:pyruvate dehydrogenase E1 component alpha subunit